MLQLLEKHKHPEVIDSLTELGRMEEIKANQRRMQQRGEYEEFLVSSLHRENFLKIV